MCGIAGIYQASGLAPSEHKVASMLAQLEHRGSDDKGIWQGSEICLGHNRLSIIAPEDGHQPFVSEDKQVSLVCNGEVFNHRSLRKELEAKGCKFQTQSDCEVILHLYRIYGIESVSKLNGQFSFALWDSQLKTLWMARDRVGILPLFYAKHNDQVLFSSEAKGLLPLTAKPRLNLQALKETFTFWAPLSGTSMFEGINEVKPGHILKICNDQITEHQYWDWSFPHRSEFITDTEFALEQFESLLTDAINLRLQADVPVAAFLSGGIDSSAVTAKAAKMNTALKTFSLTFDESKEHDESNFQKLVYKHLNVANHQLSFTQDKLATRFSQAIFHTETPILRTAPTPLMALANDVNDDQIKVVLTGEGADEILGGYDLFKETQVRHFWARQPESKWRPLLLQRLYPYMQGNLSQSQNYLQRFFSVGLDDSNNPFFSHLPRWQTTKSCQVFFSDELKASLQHYDPIEKLASTLPADFKNWHWLNKAQYVEAHTLLSNYLLPSQSDRMLMAKAVEGRYPFLDHRLIEFCNQLHPSLKLKGLDEKWLLKKVAESILPSQITKRPKQPYRAPDSKSFSKDLITDEIKYLLSEDKIAEYGYFNPKKVHFLHKKLESGNGKGQMENMAFVGIISTQLWHKHFIEDYNRNFNVIPSETGNFTRVD